MHLALQTGVSNYNSAKRELFSVKKVNIRIIRADSKVKIVYIFLTNRKETFKIYKDVKKPLK